MGDNFREVVIPEDEKSKDEFKEINPANFSKITGYLGRGKDAQNSLVYLTLKYAFISGIIITILVIINHWKFRTTENTVPDFMGDIKVTWDIVIPLITLALGYAFGKNEK